MSRPDTQPGYLSSAEEIRRNERQWAAYESRGHCIVLAGPGSGKTKVLTTKIARILAEDVRPPRGLACITYSNQCVRELKSRLDALGIPESPRLFIGTVHSFCLRQVLVPYAELAKCDLPYPLTVAPIGEQRRLFAQAVDEVLGNENPGYVRTPFDEFRRTVLNRTTPEWTGNERYAPLVTRYEQLLRDAGKIDFDTMALAGLALISDHSWIRKALKAKYPVLAVDEYQDLGMPLNVIVTRMCFEGGVRLFAVGDPDQSIYGFTGARPALMTDLADRNDVEPIHLQMNYRCGRTIAAAATVALAERRDYECVEGQPGIVLGHDCPNGIHQQVSLAVETIVPETLRNREGRRLGDIGILYLDQYDGNAIAGAAEKAGIEYVRFDQGNPYQRTPLITWLEDAAAWCAGGWKVGNPRLSALFHAWLRLNPSLRTQTDDTAGRRQLASFLNRNRAPEASLLFWLDEFALHGLLARIEGEPTMADEMEAFTTLRDASKDGGALSQFSLATFGGQRGSPERLNLTTMHSAKGLEYDVVIMIGLEQGRLPRYNATPQQKNEARRLFYVAMTRARHEVHLLWSGWYKGGGQARAEGRSEFADEVMRDLDGIVHG